MPGIVGIVSNARREDCAVGIRAMLQSILHEPFYNSGIYTCDELGLYVGWASHRGAFDDEMPLLSRRRDISLIFSGQEYSAARGGPTAGVREASRLVDRYEEKPKDFLRSLNGWFRGVLVDHRKQEAVLFNDRFGLGRVYYYEGTDGFYFASEAKALLALHPELRRFDTRSLGEFFSCNAPLENRTLFTRILRLPGASSWVFGRAGLIAKSSYFDRCEWIEQDDLGKDRFLDEFRSVFKVVLPRYFAFREPLAMSVTAGLDTRMIMSCLELAPGELPCYTFGGINGETYDVRIGRDVAESCRQPHSLIRLDQSFLSGFPRHAERTIHLAEGGHDALGAHDIFFSEKARQLAPIRLSGKFGSEIVRGSRHFKYSPPTEDLFDGAFLPFVQQAQETLHSMADGDPLSFAAFVEIPLHEYGRLAVEESQLTFATPYLDNDLVRLMYRGRRHKWTADEIPVHVISKEAPQLLRVRTDRGLRIDQGAVTRRLADLFYWKLLFKADWFFNYAPRQHADLANALRALRLDRLVMGRHIFSRYGRWLQDELADYTRAILLAPRALGRPYINGEALSRMVDDHIAGRRSYVQEINKALTIELVHRLLLDA